MRIYRLHLLYDALGENYARFVDDNLQLNRLPHERIGPVADIWPNGLQFRLGREGKVCDVLYHPNAFICSGAFRDEVARVCGEDAEWLPVGVEDLGEMYVFHPIRTVSLGPQAKLRQHRPGDNIIEIYRHDFESPHELPTCFLIPQPLSSPAGKGGFACAGIYVRDVVRTRMHKFRGVDFALVFEAA